MSENSIASIELNDFYDKAKGIIQELQKVIVGQEALINDLMVTLCAGGNALLEGVPGLGKTMLIRTLANVVECSFNRIQFTPDLMPADIVGTMIITESAEGRRGFAFERGPIFAHLILADEINRATPRTQSALLEAMQEQMVTVAGKSYQLPQPFFVLATQNPIEMEGTYPLPEAQLDRFLYKIYVPYPEEDELIEIAKRTTGLTQPVVNKVMSGDTLIAMQTLVRQVPIEERVYRYAARIIGATHPQNEKAPSGIKKNLRIGASPRGIQALVRAGKVEALLNNRKAVAINDIRKVVYPSLRHRLILNFEAQAEGVSADAILDEVVNAVQVPN